MISGSRDESDSGSRRVQIVGPEIAEILIFLFFFKDMFFFSTWLVYFKKNADMRRFNTHLNIL